MLLFVQFPSENNYTIEQQTKKGRTLSSGLSVCVRACVRSFVRSFVRAFVRGDVQPYAQTVNH